MPVKCLKTAPKTDWIYSCEANLEVLFGFVNFFLFLLSQKIMAKKDEDVAQLKHSGWNVEF